MLMKILNKRQLKFKFNRYVILGLIAFIWIFFLDSKSVVNLISVKSEINQLNKEKDYYLNKIQEDKQKIKELKTNKENLEKFAREQYLMKRKNEDIYILTTKVKQ